MTRKKQAQILGTVIGFAGMIVLSISAGLIPTLGVFLMLLGNNIGIQTLEEK